MGASTTSTDGYLTATDWNIFNTKQTAGNYLTSLSGLNISTLTNDSGYITGLNWNQIGGSQSNINNSGFNNDAGYITSADLSPYALNSSL